MPELLLADDDLFLEHVPPGQHPECPERIDAARRGVLTSCLAEHTTRIARHDVSDEELRRVHGAGHVETLAACDGEEGYLDGDTYYSARSVAASRRAAGAAVALVDTLLDAQRTPATPGAARYGFGLLRPPGHHARPHTAMGFCLINSAAVAAAHALEAGADRVLILDWDVHHGNGTEEIFFDDPRVLFLSLHQSPLYPGSGSVSETGRGKGRGFTVNLPLGGGATDAVYARAFERCVVPIVREFAPSFVIVSAGYDAHRSDPLGGMLLTTGAYAMMTHALLDALPNRGADRVMFLLEGGYDLEALTDSVRATLDAVAAPAGATPGGAVSESAVSKIATPSAEAAPGVAVPDRFERELDRIALVQREFWPL